MELLEAIYQRRSIRSYTAQQVDKTLINSLLEAAVQAPSAMNTQPWAFTILQDMKLMKNYSDKAKALLLSSIDKLPVLAKHQEALANPDYNIFYNAPTLITICAKDLGPNPINDCCLAAQNIMLAAPGLGLGTCWIGFAQLFMNQPEIKQFLKIPAEYSIVAPIIVGYPQTQSTPVTFPKNLPGVLSWN